MNNLHTKPQKITEDEFFEMLYVLPTENWHNLPNGGEFFQLSEYYSGSVTNYYVSLNGKFYEFRNEIWLKPSEVLQILKGV